MRDSIMKEGVTDSLNSGKEGRRLYGVAGDFAKTMCPQNPWHIASAQRV